MKAKKRPCKIPIVIISPSMKWTFVDRIGDDNGLYHDDVKPRNAMGYSSPGTPYRQVVGAAKIHK